VDQLFFGRWWIPISYTTSGGNFENTKNSVWMSPEEATVLATFSNLDQDAPLIINVQQTGFYRFVSMGPFPGLLPILLRLCRVNYDEQNWEMIGRALVADHSKIHRINRGQILDDGLTLARQEPPNCFNTNSGATSWSKILKFPGRVDSTIL
jgi:aminopeptidase N